MTIDKAIEILSEYVYEDKFQDITAFDNATRLGIDALKRIRAMRSSKDIIAEHILPGETKD